MSAAPPAILAMQELIGCHDANLNRNEGSGGIKIFLNL